MAKRKLKLETTTFPWHPEGALSWILNLPREKFENRIKMMPISLLLEEYGYLREAQGCLIEQFKKQSGKDYFNDARSKELRRRTEMVIDRIQKRVYNYQDALEQMDYFTAIDDLEKEKK